MALGFHPLYGGPREYSIPQIDGHSSLGPFCEFEAGVSEFLWGCGVGRIGDLGVEWAINFYNE